MNGVVPRRVTSSREHNRPRDGEREDCQGKTERDDPHATGLNDQRLVPMFTSLSLSYWPIGTVTRRLAPRMKSR